jgi:hypothetical protein
MRSPLPKLVVVIDHELLADAEEGTFDGLNLLGGLLSHPYVDLYRFRDEGPPEDAPRQSREVAGEFVPGWIVLGDRVAELGHVPVVWADREGTTVTHGALFGNGPEVAESDTRSPAYRELEPSDAAARRRADAIAVQAAGEAHADLFITRRPYLHALTWGLAGGVVIAEPEQALPLVSLYLRRQGVFVTYRSLDGTATETVNEGLFYWVGTRELLPAGWRWFTACVQHGAADDSIIYLGQSLFQRVQRALQSRDAVHGALNQPQNNDTADEALGNLDLILLGLMAAVDVTARIAHLALGLERSERGAAWQRDRWLERVETTAPDLAAVVASGTPGRQTLTILNALRNSIHGAALSALAVGSATGPREDTLVGLPHGDADAVVAAMDTLGGREAFGVREVLPERIHADPGVLLDALFAMTLDLLNELMRLTPVERLDGVSLSREHELPPPENPFDEHSRNSIRLQLGLEPPVRGA